MKDLFGDGGDSEDEGSGGEGTPYAWPGPDVGHELGPDSDRELDDGEDRGRAAFEEAAEEEQEADGDRVIEAVEAEEEESRVSRSQHLWPAGNVGHVHTGRASSIASASAPRTTTVRSGSRGRKAAWAFVAKTAIAKRLRSFMTAAVWAGEIGERVERSGGGNS
ncbi:hypothetical protein MMC10_004745 [Thelotrema lepadinum]|nr:hypothetical protein [Thelotrema lepadinum]